MGMLNEQPTIVGSSVNGTDDREARSKFWIAVYTRPRSEKKLALELSKNKSYSIETYTPTQTIISQWSDRKKKIEKVIIPMIVFCKVTEDESKFVERHPLVVKPLRWSGKKNPAIIPQEQLDRLKFMLNVSDVPVDFEPIDFQEKDYVRVVRGNLQGLIGQVERTSDGKTKLVISIDLLGGAKVEIKPLDLEPYHD